MYRKIHLWLSVSLGIIITITCFSGATMVYEKEITEWWQNDLYSVKEVKAKPLPIDSLMRLAEAALPSGVRITGLTVASDRECTYRVNLSKPRRAALFIDQYSGEVKGKYRRLPFFDTMYRLHRWLLGSEKSAEGSMPAGRWLVGVSTLALVFILLTGMLMWLANGHGAWKKGLCISVTKGWGRFWHDLHVAAGIYVAIILLAIALTGLTWSFSWYRTGFYAMFGVDAKAPGSMARGGNAAVSYRHWQKLLEEIAEKNPDYRQMTIKDGVVTVVPKGRNNLMNADKYTYHKRSGEITKVKRYDSESKATKLRSMVYMVHVGSWGGWITRLITFLAALLGATLPLTGYYLWLRRLLRKKQFSGENSVKMEKTV